tara:strand:- start:17845 stop:18309 length:465 start_codon:yes stop_codon:yes gene_type:complete
MPARTVQLIDVTLPAHTFCVGPVFFAIQVITLRLPLATSKIVLGAVMAIQALRYWFLHFRSGARLAKVAHIFQPGCPDRFCMTQSPNNPLHGVTLETILTGLVAQYGWDGLAQRIDIRCFKSDPSIKSSLTFLRKTPWAREKVEALYIRSQARR